MKLKKPNILGHFSYALRYNDTPSVANSKQSLIKRPMQCACESETVTRFVRATSAETDNMRRLHLGDGLRR